MTYTYEQGMTWAQTRANTVRSNWNGWCEALMWWTLGGLTPSYETATVARNHSDIISTDYMAAPPGAFHWWDIVGISEGHVAVASGGGWAVMASSFVEHDFQGVRVGSTSIATYHERMNGRARYRGWSYDHAGATFQTPPALAAPGASSTVQEDDMYARLIRNAQPDTSTFGAVMAINEQTGFEFQIPNVDYIPLLAARGVIAAPRGRTFPRTSSRSCVSSPHPCAPPWTRQRCRRCSSRR